MSKRNRQHQHTRQAGTRQAGSQQHSKRNSTDRPKETEHTPAHLSTHQALSAPAQHQAPAQRCTATAKHTRHQGTAPAHQAGPALHQAPARTRTRTSEKSLDMAPACCRMGDSATLQRLMRNTPQREARGQWEPRRVGDPCAIINKILKLVEPAPGGTGTTEPLLSTAESR